MDRSTKIVLGVLAGGAAVAGIAALAGGGSGPPSGPPTEWKRGAAPGALAVGPANNPEIAALLNDMRDTFASAGVRLDWITPEEVTQLHKKQWAGQHAIPPRDYWPRMIQTIRYVFEPMRAVYGAPITITNGYRPPFYNKEVTCDRAKATGECTNDGNTGSRHQWFEALDMIPAAPGAEPRIILAKLAAEIYVEDGASLKMGLGVYAPSEWPAGVHVDTGWRKRKWANTAYWLRQVATA